MLRVYQGVMRQKSWSIILALAGASSCQQLHSIETCAFDQKLAIAVGTGTSPTFTWTPACLLGYVDVVPVSQPGTTYWSASDASNSIAPGVKYGWRPPRTGATTPPRLQPDTVYRVRVGLVIGGDAIAMMADTTFRH